jgi:hypothetical protein
MFPGGIEFVIGERQKDFLREAERMRLVKTLQHQRFNEPKLYKKVTHWLGIQMVTWGAKLQDYSVEPSTQIRVIGATDVECSNC